MPEVSFEPLLQATDKAMEDVKKALTVLNTALLTRTFLVGERVTLADIAVGCNLLMLYKQVSPNKSKGGMFQKKLVWVGGINLVGWGGGGVGYYKIQLNLVLSTELIM